MKLPPHNLDAALSPEHKDFWDRSLRTALTRARSGASQRGGSEDGKGKIL